MICFLESHLFFPFSTCPLYPEHGCIRASGEDRSLALSWSDEAANCVPQRTYMQDGVVPTNDALRYGDGQWDVMAIISASVLHQGGKLQSHKSGWMIKSPKTREEQVLGRTSSGIQAALINSSSWDCSDQWGSWTGDNWISSERLFWT